MADPNIEATGKPTPIAGCTIFLVIFGMVAFLAIFATYQYNGYKKEIVNISQLEATPTPLADTTQSEKVDALVAKFDSFSKSVLDGKVATLTLNVEEMNLAVAHFAKLEPFHNKLSVAKITPDAITADIAFEVRAGFDGIRYLNGTMVMEPVIAMGSLFPIVTEIHPDTGNPVPPKMTKEFPTFLFTEYRNDEDLAPIFHKLSKVTLSEGSMSILSDPKIAQPDALPDDVSEDVDKSLSLFALLIFMFGSTAAFLYWVRKRKQKQSGEEE